ncbi:MAG: hypothetical protein JO244_00575 [Solirubrobacterales bacterium]|nr:hypothetical protein [Solirubrobacterales bacterium]
MTEGGALDGTKDLELVVPERALEEALGEEGGVAGDGGPGGVVHGGSGLKGEADADALVQVEEEG